MTAVWEGKKYGFNFVTDGAEGLTTPPNYAFKLARTLVTGNEYYYVVTPELGVGANPFTQAILLPQPGRCLVHYLPPGQRLDPAAIPPPDAPSYKQRLANLMDEIIKSKIEPDPDSYERLVGYIKVDNAPVFSKVTFYKVENTHVNGKLLLVVQLQIAGSSPGGSIGVITQ